MRLAHTTGEAELATYYLLNMGAISCSGANVHTFSYIQKVEVTLQPYN